MLLWEIYTVLLLSYFVLNLETMLCHVGVLLLNNTLHYVSVYIVAGKVQSSGKSKIVVVGANTDGFSMWDLLQVQAVTCLLHFQVPPFRNVTLQGEPAIFKMMPG